MSRPLRPRYPRFIQAVYRGQGFHSWTRWVNLRISLHGGRELLIADLPRLDHQRASYLRRRLGGIL